MICFSAFCYDLNNDLKKKWTSDPFNYLDVWWFSAHYVCRYQFLCSLNPYISGNSEFPPLWLREQNKTAVTVRVNVYAIDFKGQSLVHVSLLFHTFRQKHELRMRESHSCVVRLDKTKPGGCVQQTFEDTKGYYLFFSKTNTKKKSNTLCLWKRKTFCCCFFPSKIWTIWSVLLVIYCFLFIVLFSHTYKLLPWQVK